MPSLFFDLSPLSLSTLFPWMSSFISSSIYLLSSLLHSSLLSFQFFYSDLVFFFSSPPCLLFSSPFLYSLPFSLPPSLPPFFSTLLLFFLFFSSLLFSSLLSSGRNNIFPTLFLLWRCPHAIRTFVIHAPVSGQYVLWINLFTLLCVIKIANKFLNSNVLSSSLIGYDSVRLI